MPTVSDEQFIAHARAVADGTGIDDFAPADGQQFALV